MWEECGRVDLVSWPPSSASVKVEGGAGQSERRKGAEGSPSSPMGGHHTPRRARETRTRQQHGSLGPRERSARRGVPSKEPLHLLPLSYEREGGEEEGGEPWPPALGATSRSGSRAPPTDELNVAPTDGTAGRPARRSTLYSAHRLTNAAPSGLGRQLAGTESSPPLLAPDASDSAVLDVTAASLGRIAVTLDALSLELELHVEVERLRYLAELHERFAELCREEGLEKVPLNALERWRMLGAWHDGAREPAATGSSSGGSGGPPQSSSVGECTQIDPVLPSYRASTSGSLGLGGTSPCVGLRPPNTWLEDDLCRAGITRSAAARIAEVMARRAATAAHAVAALRTRLAAASTQPSEHSDRASEPPEVHVASRGGQRSAKRKRNERRAPPSPEDRAVGGATFPDGAASTTLDGPLVPAQVDVEELDTEAVRLVWRGHSVRVTRAMLQKLRCLFDGRHAAVDRAASTRARDHNAKAPEARAHASGIVHKRQATGADAPHRERAFLLSVMRLLLRYDSLGCAGMHAAIGGGVHEVLRTRLGVRFECCASPLNAFHGVGAYCSAFADTDGAFGSYGSFAAFTPRCGAFELNPPFIPGFIDAVTEHALVLLGAAAASTEPLTFAIVLPGWLDSLGYCALAGSPYTRRAVLVAAVDHGFVDGAQHTRVSSYRQSPFDTCVFICQNDAAVAAAPVTEVVVEEIERALARCTPTREAIAALPPSERPRGSGHGRVGKRKRWRRGSAGKPKA